MVMADFNDQRRRKRLVNKERQKVEDMPQPLKVPIILSKNSVTTCDKNNDQSESSKNQERISVLSKSSKKEDLSISAKVKHVANGIIPECHSKVTGVQNRENPTRDLALTLNYPGMVLPSKLISGLLKWNDAGNEFMVEQTDYVVVGVLGLQNVGKSTVLSYIGEVPEKNNKLIFKPQIKGTRESGVHVTSGIDMFVTKERMILLDSQALLSISHLIELSRHEKKHAPDFARFDAGIDIQSVQLAAFMLCVCNYVIVVMDWFVDERIFTILRLAEMLKPLMSYEEMQSEAQISTASLIFALNKARPSDQERRIMMEREIEGFMRGSRINYRGSLQGENFFSSSSQRTNLVYLPRMIRGSLEFEETMKSLGHQLLALPRKLPINKFPEGKWLVFAMRAWDLIRKSQLMNDYDRLLS